MGSRAYILIETAMGRSLEVRTALEKCRWVEHVERVAGPYDVVAVARADGDSRVSDAINRDLNGLEGVVRMVVCPISSLFEGVQQPQPVVL
jgi:hypothetical protein